MFEILAVAAAMALTAGDVRSPAPAAHCLDARAVREVWWQSPTQLLVASGKGLHRVRTSIDCPAVGSGSALLARDGWVCGGAGELLQSAELSCPISAVEQLSSTEARRALRSRERSSRLQDAFSGSNQQCLDPTRVRTWSVAGSDLIVSTARSGATGPTRYRVRLVGNCPEAQVRDILSWRSVTGNGRICGVPGEFAVFTSQHSQVVNVARAFLSGPPGSAELRGCAVASVEAIGR